jgi:hypothetical protein
VFSTAEDVDILDAVFKQLGWYDLKLLQDFVTLGSNTATERNGDTLTLYFVEGGGGDVLSFTKDVQLLLVLCRLLLLSQNTLSQFRSICYTEKQFLSVR